MATKLSLPMMVSYGTGQIAEAVKNSGFSVFLLFYYNQVLGVSATATSIALAIALVFDAITDPLAGSLSDKLNSRWGRRHPFMLVAAVPLAIAFYLLFNPPAGFGEMGYALWLGTFAVLVRASMTFYYIPHLALGAELAQDYSQRSTLYAYNTVFQFMGSAAFIPLSYLLFFPTTEEFNPALLNQSAYGPWAVFGGALMIAAIVICAIGTAGEIPRLKEQTPPQRIAFSFSRLLRELIDIFSNRSFLVLFIGMVFSMFILSVEAVFNPFMGFHFWGMTTEQLAYVPIGQLTGLALSVVLIPILTGWLDKKWTLIGCAFITLININTPIVLKLLGVSWFPSEGSTPLLVILIVTGGVTAMLAAVVFASLNSMFADIADEHELEVGERREGIIFSARAFANKSMASLGLVFGGVLLDYIAFPRGATLGTVDPDIVWQLGFIAGPATSIFTIVGLVLYLGYKIDRRRHAEIKAELAARSTS